MCVFSAVIKPTLGNSIRRGGGMKGIKVIDVFITANVGRKENVAK